MSTKVQYGTPYRFPEMHADGEDLPEIRRYVKDLSQFRTEHFVKPAIIIVDADLSGGVYLMQPDDHCVYADFSGAGVRTITLPNPDVADAAVYTVKEVATAGSILIDSAGSANVEAAASVTLATISAYTGTYPVASFVCDGTDWWYIT